ncbi:leucine-rich repeat protein lrr1 [Cystoisospora suis]|uniref:Leucine-rich repeat protein lrr1 n=1 Tax=Cystoisospora suis TaxID=483139 RepID=A0A2C6LIQ1_9APIC|nr:leucine-rich repeat protein lrr1 [Cystoisospora suis]
MSAVSPPDAEAATMRDDLTRAVAQIAAGSACGAMSSAVCADGMSHHEQATDDSDMEARTSVGREDPEGITYQRLGVDLELKQTDEDLSFQTSRIHRIENLELCPRLKNLELNANDIEKIENLEVVPELEQLELYQNRIRKIENLETLVHLRVLDLSFNKIRKIEGLERLGQLVKLYLSSNRIENVEGLESLLKLELLELGSNRIRNVVGIGQLTNLKELWLGKNKLTSMRLPFLPKLQRLSLQSNRLTTWDVRLFDDCPALEELYLSHNQLPGEIPGEIRHLRKLKIFDIGVNAIGNIEAAAQLPELQELWMNNNKIETLEGVKCLRGVGSLHTLYLEGNPVQANLGPSYRQNLVKILPQLRQLDALLLSEKVNVIEQPLSGKVGSTRKPKSIMKHDD